MFVYILSCRDGSLYTGWTDNLDRRLQSHLEGRAAKYTRSRLPVLRPPMIPNPDMSDDVLSLSMFWAGALMVFTPMISAGIVLLIWRRGRAKAASQPKPSRQP